MRLLSSQLPLSVSPPVPCPLFLTPVLLAPPELIKKVLSMDEKIKHIAQELFEQKSLLVMGRGYNYATCLEGALVSPSGQWAAFFLGSAVCSSLSAIYWNT